MSQKDRKVRKTKDKLYSIPKKMSEEVKEDSQRKGAIQAMEMRQTAIDIEIEQAPLKIVEQLKRIAEALEELAKKACEI